MIGEAEVAFYKANGYLVVEKLLDPATLGELRRITEEIVAGAGALTDHSDIIDLEPGHSPAQPRVRRIKKPHLAHPFYRELAADSRVTGVLARLIGPNIRMRSGGKVNMKAAGYGAPVEWHQDWAFYPHTNDDVLAVGLLLDDTDLDNGPLMVLPGTHTGPTHDHHSAGAFCGGIDPTRCDLDFAAAVPLTGKAGAMTVHHARLVHGSAMNRSTRPRRLLLYEYAAADAWPMAGIEPIADFDEFNGRIVLGEPTIEPRLVPVPVRMPLPRASHQGSIYENQRTLAHSYFEHAPGARRVAE